MCSAAISARQPEAHAAFRTNADAGLKWRMRSMPNPETTPLTESDLFYLRSIKRSLDQLVQVSDSLAETCGYGIANAALDDNRDWLDCFIDEHARRLASVKVES